MTAAPKDVEQALLAPVLELTVLAVQAGSRAVPRMEPPALLRPYLGFTRSVPRQALRAARRVLDDDAALRERVASAVTEDLVGKAGVLFVARPPGWDEQLAELVAAERLDVDAAASELAENRAARSQAKEIRVLRADLDRAEATQERLQVETEALRTQLGDERSRRLAAERSRDDSLRELARCQDDLARSRTEAEVAAELLSQALTSNRELAERVDGLERDDRARSSLDAALDAATESVRSVHAALLLLGDRVDRDRANGDGVDAPGPSRGVRARSATPSQPQRVEVTVPGGLFHDTAGAAEEALRSDGAVALIDGYNVAKLRWPTAPPHTLRDQLIAACRTVAGRTGAVMHLVFDGEGEVASSKVLRGVRLRVSFTARGVEADDAILDQLRSLPLHIPVVVVSSDRRVADGARRGGAFPVSSAVFAELF